MYKKKKFEPNYIQYDKLPDGKNANPSEQLEGLKRIYPTGFNMIDAKEKYTPNDVVTEYSSIHRYFAATQTAIDFKIRAVDTSVVVFRLFEHKKSADHINSVKGGATSSVPNHQIIYGFLYLNHPVDTETIADLKPVAYSFGPSFQSSDGEYRSKLCSYGNIKLIQDKFPKLFEMVLSYVKYVLPRRSRYLNTNIFIPTSDRKKHKPLITEFVLQNNLELILFAFAWFHDMYNASVGMVERHVNKMYSKIMYGFEEIDVSAFREIRSEFKDEIEKFRTISSHIVLDIDNTPTTSKFGQKIFLMHVYDAIRPYDLSSKIWREVIIQKRLSDLVINHITAGIPIYGSVFYIKNDQIGLFDNEALYKMHHKSELAKRVKSILHAALFDLNTYQKQEKNFNQEDTFIRRDYSQRIQAMIDNSNKKYILSEIACVVTSEYVGRTWADAYNVSKRSEKYNQAIGYCFERKGQKFFAKYLFELIYTLYAMHSKCGIIHADLHANNACIGATYYKTNTDVRSTPNPGVLFVIDDYQFVFPSYGYYASVIDYSRAVCNPSKIGQFKRYIPYQSSKFHFNENALSQSSLSDLADLISRMYQLISKDSSEYVMSGDQYINIVKQDPNTFFKLATIEDIRFIVSWFSKTNVRNPVIDLPQESMELILNIEKCLNKHTKTLMSCITNPEQNIAAARLEKFCAFDILTTCFHDYLGGECDPLIDIFSFNNELKYSLSDPELYPPEITQAVFVRDGVLYCDKKLTQQRIDKSKRVNPRDEEIICSVIPARHESKF